MILTCPACATSYFIADDLVGPNGRKVRCKSCGEVWKASNDEPLELTVAPEPVVIEPDPEVSLAETPARGPGTRAGDTSSSTKPRDNTNAASGR